MIKRSLVIVILIATLLVGGLVVAWAAPKGQAADTQAPGHHMMEQCGKKCSEMMQDKDNTSRTTNIKGGHQEMPFNF